jgi:glyoxylase-like metal-dependent hydrolase (beta-lactamase superfamily II)
MKIFPLSEGTFTIDKTKLFVPFDENSHDLQSRPVGSLLVEIQPFVVITSNDVLLLDMGLGFSANGSMQIHRNMQEVGIDPSSVTKILMTHLHKDHAGGVSKNDDHNMLSFPQATYYIQRREFDFAMKTGSPSFIPEELAVLATSNRVSWMKDDHGQIDDYISYELTGAHSPFHQVFWIREGGETVFFGGDDAPQLQQMKHRFVAKYDYDGRKATELRKKLWHDGQNENWTFLFYHDVKNPIHRSSN